MKRALAVAVLSVAAAFPVSAHASTGTFGGTCDGVVDFDCRRPCTDELDCGLIPPCRVWVAAACVL